MKILIISPKNKTVFNFRGDLIKDMIKCGHEVVVIGPNNEFVDEIYALGVSKFIEIPFVKDNTSIKGDFIYFGQLKKTLKQERPDLVFSYTIKPVVYGSLAAKSAKVKRIIAMVTGLGRVYASKSLKATLIRFITKILYKKAFKACDSVIFQNSDDLHTFVGQRYLPQEKAKLVNGSGVNMQRFKKAPLPEDISFLMVSRIIREKGVLDYCQAAKMIKAQYPKVRFVLLGGFDNSIGAIRKDDIQEYIDKGVIEFPGETKDPLSYYQCSSVFVLPSYYREGLPRTILEAMSCGRTVITTDWPGCKDPIKNGINGYLVKVRDSEDLASKMKELIENEDLLKRFSENAFETCKEKYDVSLVNKTMKEYLGY